MPTKHQPMMQMMYKGAPMAMMVLLLYLSANVPQIRIVKMLASWLVMVRAMIYGSESPSVFIMYTVKNGVAIFSANTQAELKVIRRTKFRSRSGRLKSRKIFSFVTYDSGSCTLAR